jgi:Ni/Co efflux regulator RcnB
MTRISLILLLGFSITISSAAFAGHNTQHGGYDNHQGYQYGRSQDRHRNNLHGRHHHKHNNRHMRRQHRHYSHGGNYRPPALFSFSYGSHGAAIDYRSYPYNGYLYSNRHGQGR